MTNYERAVNLLKTAKNVNHWNELRQIAKEIVTMKELIKIDSSGLIVQILGADKHTVYTPIYKD